jgi:hypothetical protein
MHACWWPPIWREQFYFPARTESVRRFSCLAPPNIIPTTHPCRRFPSSTPSTRPGRIPKQKRMLTISSDPRARNLSTSIFRLRSVFTARKEGHRRILSRRWLWQSRCGRAVGLLYESSVCRHSMCSYEWYVLAYLASTNSLSTVPKLSMPSRMRGSACYICQ